MKQTAIDVGGTFTDVVSWDGERLITAKVSTTPDQSDGVIAGIGAVTEGGTGLVHGTTVATNAVLQRAGATTALVTDEGFEDLIEIGRQDRPSLYDLEVVRPEPIAPRERRVGVPGRAVPGNPGRLPDDLGGLVDALADIDPEAVAVSLLYSFEDGSRERAVAEAIRARLPDVAVSVSSDVVAEFREFERQSTTLLNAFLVPVVSAYLRRLAAAVAEVGVVGAPTVMRSSGGLMSLESAAALPTAILLSGPAGGVVATTALGEALGLSSVISFDMGGTSTDVCRIESGRPLVSYERSIDGLPCLMPSVAIHTVGAGGGSVAWMDAGGALGRSPQRRSLAGPGVLRTGWHRADRDRCRSPRRQDRGIDPPR
jgi:N-methylhydantoinase A